VPFKHTISNIGEKLNLSLSENHGGTVISAEDGVPKHPFSRMALSAVASASAFSYQLWRRKLENFDTRMNFKSNLQELEFCNSNC
jgi:hypothetical protein